MLKVANFGRKVFKKSSHLCSQCIRNNLSESSYLDIIVVIATYLTATEYTLSWTSSHRREESVISFNFVYRITEEIWLQKRHLIYFLFTIQLSFSMSKYGVGAIGRVRQHENREQGKTTRLALSISYRICILFV